MSELRGKKVLVTGATGFIGGRLVERLMAEGAQVRALVSGYSRCARIARFPVELFRADLLDSSKVAEAASECSLIFHCAYGSRGRPEERRRVNVEGTENVIAAAAASGAHLVHLSTQMVYGVLEQGDVNEESARVASGSTYGDSKLEAEEQVVRASAGGLPVTVLQPTAVYGPYAPVWTVGVLERMRSGRVPLVDGGSGTCNAVYIDDLVEAMVLAGTSDSALGETFLVSAAEPVTWRDFYGSYEELLGLPATVPLSLAEATAGSERNGNPTLLRELPGLLAEPVVRQRLAGTREGKFVSRLLRGSQIGSRLRRSGVKSSTPELDKLRSLNRPREAPVHSLSPSEAKFFASRARVRIDKAQRLLGYEPKYGLDEGMARTGVWARWAGLVPDAGKERVAVAGSA